MEQALGRSDWSYASFAAGKKPRHLGTGQPFYGRDSLRGIGQNVQCCSATKQVYGAIMARLLRQRPILPAGRALAAIALLGLLAGCNMVVMNPSGDIAVQQRDLVIISTGLMLLIIIPVVILVGLFAWRYRANNKDARYEPDWDHSTQLELVIWSVPLLIIICLGAITWTATHLLDPYRPLERVAPGRPVAAHVKPLEVQVVALDWKWLFIYPEYNVATVNELVAPVDRPIVFKITSSSVMNSFYVPALAGQIYAMPGMETKLHAVINKPGDYAGFSANYSGAGFSGMRFRFHGLTDSDFAGWVAKTKASKDSLDRATYIKLEQPSEKEPVRRFATVEDGLYDAALNMCVDPAKMCAAKMMQIDARGGLGKAGISNVRPVETGSLAGRAAPFGPRQSFVGEICTSEDAFAASLPGKTSPARPPGTATTAPRATPVALDTRPASPRFEATNHAS